MKSRRAKLAPQLLDDCEQFGSLTGTDANSFRRPDFYPQADQDYIKKGSDNEKAFLSMIDSLKAK